MVGATPMRSRLHSSADRRQQPDLPEGSPPVLLMAARLPAQDHDVVISSSSAFAQDVRTHPDAVLATSLASRSRSRSQIVCHACYK